MTYHWFAKGRRAKNLLNDLHEDDVVYRVFSKNRFFEMLNNKKLSLVKPRLWDGNPPIFSWGQK